MWCQGFSEPDAGSDLSALRTAAVRDGDHYIVNGQKIWTSYAHAADFCFVLVRTAATENPRRGISVLLVPMDLPGIEVREIPTLADAAPRARGLLPRRGGARGLPPGRGERGLADHPHAAGQRAGAELAAFCHRRTHWTGSLTRPRDGDADVEDGSFWEHMGRAAAWTAASRVLNYAAVQAWSDDSAEFPNLAAVYRASMAQMELGAAQTFIDILGPDALAGNLARRLADGRRDAIHDRRRLTGDAAEQRGLVHTRAAEVTAARAREQEDWPAECVADAGLALPAVIARRAAANPDATFLVEIAGQSMTYQQTWQAIRRRMAALARAGVSAGDAVASFLPQSADAQLLWLANALLGRGTCQ